LNGANLAGADLRAVNFSEADFEQFESIAGADFSMAQGLTDAMRSRLLKHPQSQLETRNSFTLKTTIATLTID
jgi:uncharacterized protein YjbI with pentapeptide repeats